MLLEIDCGKATKGGEVAPVCVPVLPIVLAPCNDLLGLVITEGIEDALTMHELTGLGAWAAGSASRMPALAAVVPDYVKAVTVMVDANDAGINNTAKLGALLERRRISVELPILQAEEAA